MRGFWVWVLLLGLNTAPSWAQDASSCRRIGTDSGLQQSDTRRLCQGAQSSAPVKCYLQARDTAGLGTEDAIQLCQCAQTAKPAQCVQASMQRLHVGLEDSLLSCEDQSRKNLAVRQCLGMNQPFG